MAFIIIIIIILWGSAGGPSRWNATFGPTIITSGFLLFFPPFEVFSCVKRRDWTFGLVHTLWTFLIFF